MSLPPQANFQVGMSNGRGGGRVYSGHDGHMVNIEQVDMAFELCDLTSSLADDDFDHWIEVVSERCLWDASVVAIERLGGTGTARHYPREERS